MAKPAEKKEPEGFRAYRANNVEKRPKLGAELGAIGREMLKDVRNMVVEVYSGSAEKAGEPGTPFNPTPQLVTEGLKGKEVDLKTDQMTVDMSRVVYGDANIPMEKAMTPQMKEEAAPQVEAAPEQPRLKDDFAQEPMESPEQSPEIQSEIERMRGTQDRGMEM